MAGLTIQSADLINDAPVTPTNPLPVTITTTSDGLAATPAGTPNHTEALLERLLEVTKVQSAILAAILVTLGNNGGGFTDPSEATDLLGSDSTPLLS